MNTFELIDIAFTALEQRKHSSSGDWQHGRKSAQSGAQELPVEDSPNDGSGTARAIDPNHCSKCGYGSCYCDIASNE